MPEKTTQMRKILTQKGNRKNETIYTLAALLQYTFNSLKFIRNADDKNK